MRIIRQKGKAQAEKQYKNYVYCFTIEHINFIFDMRMMFIDTYTTPFNLSIICYAFNVFRRRFLLVHFKNSTGILEFSIAVKSYA